jgi:hypothetical protein
MALWEMPEKILLPSHMFEGQVGRLRNGDQVMGYIASHGPLCMRPRCLSGGDPWADQPQRWTAVVHRFSPSGQHLASHSRTGTHPKPAAESGWSSPEETARDRQVRADALDSLLKPLKAAGWEDADILVRPFYVFIDGLGHGLALHVEGENTEGDEEFDPQWVRLDPFGFMFHRPWDSGRWDS